MMNFIVVVSQTEMEIQYSKSVAPDKALPILIKKSFVLAMCPRSLVPVK
jgi:hypothetical protein